MDEVLRRAQVNLGTLSQEARDVMAIGPALLQQE